MTPKKKKQTQPPAVPKARRRNRNRNNKASSSGLGTMRIRDKELLTTVDKAETVLAYPCLGPSGKIAPPVLSKLQAMFSRIKFHSLKVWWVGSTGTTKGGSVILAWDRGGTYAKATTITRQQVAGIQPNVCVAGYENATRQPLTLSPSSLMGGVGAGWYTVNAADFGDAFPAILLVNVSGEAQGDVWIEYDVSLSGLHT